MKKNFLKAAALIGAAMMLPFLITVFMSSGFKNNTESNGKVVTSYNDTLSITNVEAFVTSAVAAYYQQNDSPEFLKALAVVIRTHAQYARNSEGITDASTLGIDVYSDADMKAAWGGNYEEYAMLVESAVNSTEGIYILSSKDEIILPYFHLISSGYTRSGAYEWLVSVDSSEDCLAENFLSTVEITENDLKEKTKAIHPDVVWEDSACLSTQIIERDEAGYVVEVMVGNIILTGQEFAKIFGLSSPCFSILQGDGMITVTAKGSGNGYGMSLNCARAKAANGMKYEEIIYWFYKNCKLKTE